MATTAVRLDEEQFMQLLALQYEAADVREAIEALAGRLEDNIAAFLAPLRPEIPDGMSKDAFMDALYTGARRIQRENADAA